MTRLRTFLLELMKSSPTFQNYLDNRMDEQLRLFIHDTVNTLMCNLNTNVSQQQQ